jgi:hypothetical protein
MLYEGEKLVQEFDQSDIAIAHPHLWSIKDPFLYRLVTALGNETREDTFGFRDAKWTPKGFFLKWGVHQTHRLKPSPELSLCRSGDAGSRSDRRRQDFKRAARLHDRSDLPLRRR